MDKDDYFCSFCQREGDKIKMLITGSGDTCICADCVDKCQTAINDRVKNKSTDINDLEETSFPTPREIKSFLDDYIIGQSDAKTVVSVAAYNHYKRTTNPNHNDVEIDKSNILLLGPTGSGKTLLAQTLAKAMDVPCVIYDATSLTESGYVGEDTDAIIGRLLAAANNNVSLAEKGIVFIDEIDKKRGHKSASGGRDVTGEGVQQALLKLLEGSEVGVKLGNNKEQVVNTKNILFILSGAFIGIDDISKGRANIGFESTKTPISGINKVPPSEDFIKYGIIPELVGRLPVVALLDELSEDQLIGVLTKPKNAITKQYAALFDLDGVHLSFTDDALHNIANSAITNKTGARGLRSVIEKSLAKIQFNLPELSNDGLKKVVLDINDGQQIITMFNENDKEIKVSLK